MTDLKADLRKQAFAARKEAHALGAGEATERLLSAIGLATGKIIAGYMPIRTEIDPRPAMTALHAQGATLCVPVIEGAGLPLMFREWTPEGALMPGPFGAQVPAEGDWVAPELLIVPLVAFDHTLARLGYGGGFYDRTLERLRAQKPTQAIGFAYDAQEMPNVPQEPTDQPLDALVTPTRTLAKPSGAS